MVVTCSIEFDRNPSGIFFAGQVVAGRVTLTSDKARLVKGVLLKIVGAAKAKWSESTGNQTYYYHGQERYLDSNTVLVSSEEGPPVEIAAGTSSFGFSCQLPSECPSSFEGRHGHIRYMVKVVIVRPLGFDKTHTKGFTVLSSVVLDTLLRLPTQAEISKTFGLFSRSAPLSLSATLPKSSYLPGEVLPVDLVVRNRSNVDVLRLKVALVMLTTYFNQSGRHKKRVRTVVTKAHGPGVRRGSDDRSQYVLRVPATPPTCLHLCLVIQIRYELEVTAKVRTPHSNPGLHMPVAISAVPIDGADRGPEVVPGSLEKGMECLSVSQQAPGQCDPWTQSPLQVRVLPVAEEAADAVAPWPGAPDSPPPSYEEAMHTQRANLAADEEPGKDGGESETEFFAPRYPVFHPRPPRPPVDGGDHEEKPASPSSSRESL